MRTRASLFSIAAVGAIASFAATTAIAGAKPTTPAAAACSCHAAPAARHVRRSAVRTRAHATRRVWKRMVMTGAEPMWHDTQGWHSHHGWSESHEWSDGGDDLGYRYEQRPWATDRFGYLTWPGKTHFISSHPADGAMQPPPPPMDGNAMPPPPPPPPAGWSDGPSGPQKGVEQDQDGYNVYRF